MRPFSEVPRPGKLKFLRSFMPGGEFHDSSFLEFAMTMRKRYGDLFILPGSFGRKDWVVTFDPKDIETVFRNEGIWPHREGLDSLIYFREKIRPDVYAEKKGLVATWVERGDRECVELLPKQIFSLRSQSEEWGKFRSAVNPIFMQPKGLKMYYEPLSNINNEFIER